jgi:hypothetical protein
MMFAASGDSIDAISLVYYKSTSVLGFPVIYKIRSIWLRVELPGNMAFPIMSSPRIQPTDHISTALEY